MQIEAAPFIAFLVGVATGAGGQYFADKYSDQRREKEAASKVRRSFLDLAAKMPAVLYEIRCDLRTENMNLVREFLVLPSRGVSIGGPNKQRFTYYATEHEALREKLDLLAHAGFIRDVSTTSTPIFRMEDHFVELVEREIKHGQ